MRLIINNLGKTIIAVVVVLLAITLISAVFLPGVRDLVNTIFPGETNYIDNSGGTPTITLLCANTDIEISTGESIDLFSNVTAQYDDTNLVSQLRDDYEKPVEERSHVFIYQLDENDAPIALKPQINTTEPGKWTVVYIVDNGVESVSTTVSYTVK